MSCFTCFSTELDLWIDDYVVPKGDSQNITFNLVQFQVDILGVFFDGFKICFQKKWISVRIDFSKDYSKESNCSVSTEVLWRVGRSNYCENEKEEQDKSHCNDVEETRIYQRQKSGTLVNCFWEDSAVRALKNIAPRIPMPLIELVPWRWARECQMLTTRPHGMSNVHKLSSTAVVALGIPMPGIQPGPWRWKRHILIDEFHVDILRAFFDVCKIFFQWKCIIVGIDCSKDYVGRHEFINDRNLGRRSIAFGKILQFGRWKILLLEFLTRESDSGHGGELESARS